MLFIQLKLFHIDFRAQLLPEVQTYCITAFCVCRMIDAMTIASAFSHFLAALRATSADSLSSHFGVKYFPVEFFRAEMEAIRNTRANMCGQSHCEYKSVRVATIATGAKGDRGAGSKRGTQ